MYKKNMIIANSFLLRKQPINYSVIWKVNRFQFPELIIFLSSLLLVMSLTLHTSMAFAEEDTRIVHHALGKTAITGKPKRVVSLFQGATDTLVALGVEPVGAVESWSQKPMYQYLRPKLTNVHYVGLETQPSLEDIALLKPDLIIATRFRNEKTYSILSQIAPTVALEEVYDFQQTLITVGEALGREKQANQLLKQWNQRINQTRAGLQGKYGSRWPPTVSLLEFRDDHIRAYSPKSFSGAILTELGFDWPILVADEQWALQKLASKESIPLIDSDISFIFMRDKPSIQTNYQSWIRHPLWQQTKAAKSKQIYQVDSINWNLAGGIISANNVLNEIDAIFLTADKETRK